MATKRLRHAADTLCKMFLGWRLANDYGRLEVLGSGELKIDVLGEACTFDDRPIEPLLIAGELSAWLRRDLEEHAIDPGKLSSARVAVTLSISELPWRERARGGAQYFDASGESIKAVSVVRCEMQCRSEITTDDGRYTAAATGVEQWPKGPI